MDDQRFDAIARAVAVATSRRSLLRAIAGGIGGGALVLRGRSEQASAQETCQPAGGQCGGEFDCCTPNVCDFGGCFGPVLCSVTDFGQPGNDCTTSDDCCGLLECVEGTCEQTCLFLGEACTESAECCEGAGCGKAGNCTLCAGDGAVCGSDADCCDDLTCQDETCQAPPTCAGETCDGECCDGFACVDGVCVEETPACAMVDDECGADVDCCVGICCGGACHDVECCVDDPDPNIRCAEGTICVEGGCAPVVGPGATVTIHNAECYHGVGDIFGECHENRLAGVAFSIGGAGVTTGDDGVAGAPVAAGFVTVSQDAGVFAGYLGAYVYCSEQNSGTVLYDASADTGSVAFTAADGDEVICDWYNITEA